MSQNATTIPPKGLWKIKGQDFIKGLWLAIGSSVLAFGYAITQNHWHMLTFLQSEPYLNTIAAGFVAYIGKNWASNNVGQLFTSDKPVVHVDVKELDDLKVKAEQTDQQKSDESDK